MISIGIINIGLLNEMVSFASQKKRRIKEQNAYTKIINYHSGL